MKKILFVLCLKTVFISSLLANSLMMATTTSTDNTGLLDYLAPKLLKDTGIDLKWVSTGTGKALKMGENCDVDVLLVHAPSSEKVFVENGFGVNRKEVMYNDFILIGPKNDPIGVSGMNVTQALLKIKDNEGKFFSRGDNSGTNKKEISLWKNALGKIPENASWYVQTGQGMLNTINMSSEKNAYTMTDRGTWIKYESQKDQFNPMKIVVEGDKSLFNQYSVITINKDKCKNVKSHLSEEFTNWIVSPSIQEFIGEFKLMNKALFVPNANK